MPNAPKLLRIVSQNIYVRVHFQLGVDVPHPFFECPLVVEDHQQVNVAAPARPAPRLRAEKDDPPGSHCPELGDNFFQFWWEYLGHIRSPGLPCVSPSR